MRRQVALIVAAMALAGLAACSALQRAEQAVADVEQGHAQTREYALDAARAREVIFEAIMEGWPDVAPEALGAGRIGYQFQLRFLIDREQMIVEALPVRGGYVFRVINRGTAPAVGVPARNKLIPLIEKRAAS